MRLEVAGRSDVGKVRTRNEDRFAIQADRPDGATLCVLADGLGGHTSGDLAATVAVEQTLAALANGSDLADAVAQANVAVHRRATSEPEHRGMGTTITCVLIDLSHEQARLAHVGDSRAYLIRAGTARQLTRDHSWVTEEVAAGRLTPEEARHSTRRNLVTRALGLEASVTPEERSLALQSGDALLLCSDGVHGVVSEDELAAACAMPAEQGAGELLTLVLARGAPDNATVVVARLLDGSAPPAAIPVTRPLPEQEVGSVAPPARPGRRTRPRSGSGLWLGLAAIVVALAAIAIVVALTHGV